MRNDRYLRSSALGFSLAALILCGGGQIVGAAEKKPAVLFTGGFHRQYFLLPMHAEGIELHTCGVSELPERLKTGKYNVVVPTEGFTDPKIVAALKAFMAEGGGVFVMYGHTGGWATPESWKARQTFLEEYGARYLWVDIKERDASRNVRSSYYLGLYYTENISPPFGQGVKGLLYQNVWHMQGTPTVPLAIDDEWTPAVRGSDTAEAVPFTEEKNPVMREYVPEKPVISPVLLAARKVGQGRLAAFGMSGEWVFWSPTNCPPVEDMMTRGAGGRPSHWVRVLANTFRWLAEPTLAAGKGGEPTPAAMLAEPKRQPSEPAALRDWTQAPPLQDQGQLPGLVGARSSYSGGKGTVEEWAKAAKAAGLRFLVFLDPLEQISREDYEKLKADCAKYTDDTFFACPGLRYKDVHTKTSTFAYGENILYPLAELLTEDGKYLDNTKKIEMYRLRHLFGYVYEQNAYRGQFGYYNHKANIIPPWEYRWYSLFSIHSTDNGKPQDDDFEDFASLQAMRMHLTPLALSLMDSPAQIARAVKEDWLVLNTAPGEFADGTYSAEYGKGVAAMRKLFKEEISWLRPFQYITRGPRILCWNGCWPVVLPRGDWFRPDLARYSARLHVTSDVGLKEIRIMSMGRVLMRFLPKGAKEFDRTMEFENSQQRDIYPIVEDTEGNQAIGMIVRNTSTLWTEFICGDRENMLNYGWSRTRDGILKQFTHGGGNSVTHNKGCWTQVSIAPPETLTVDNPTLPIDGAPQGDKVTAVHFVPWIATAGFPSSETINCRPRPVLASPDVFIGGGGLDYLGSDPTSLGNAWGWWSPVEPNPWIEGLGFNTVFHPQVGGMRSGWYEFFVTARKDMPIQTKGLAVRFTSMQFIEMRDGKGDVYRTDGKDVIPPVGPFGKGAYALLAEPGGATGLVSPDDNLSYEVQGKNIYIGLRLEGDRIAKGTPLNMKLGYMGAAATKDISDLRRYIDKMGAPLVEVNVRVGKLTSMDHIAMHLDGAREGVRMRIKPLGLDARLPVLIENMRPNWDVWLLDRALKRPNWRQLPKVGTTAYAALPSEVEQDLFIGHPIVADRDEVCISLCNLLPGRWLITLHNPTDQQIKTTVRSAAAWTPFKLGKSVRTIPAGSSVDIALKTAK